MKKKKLIINEKVKDYEFFNLISFTMILFIIGVIIVAIWFTEEKWGIIILSLQLSLAIGGSICYLYSIFKNPDIKIITREVEILEKN